MGRGRGQGIGGSSGETDSLARREVLSLVVDALEVVLRRVASQWIWFFFFLPADLIEPVIDDPERDSRRKPGTVVFKKMARIVKSSAHEQKRGRV